MGKKSQTGTSKKSPPTWREKLAEFDINKIYEGRTCEIVLMAELMISYTEAILLFHIGAKENPTNVIKSINFESLMNDIKQPPQAPPKEKGSKSKGDPTIALFQSAAVEAQTFLSTAQQIPMELIAQILKLKIINMINADVTLRDQERILEIEKLKLANAPPPDDKDKGKGKSKEKDKKKAKGKAAAIKLPLEERQLYFVISGFYDISLMSELFNVGITLSAILEIASPNCIMLKEKFAARIAPRIISAPGLRESLFSDNSSVGDEEDDEVILFINQLYDGSKDSICHSVFGDEKSITSMTSSIYGKITELNNYWNLITQQLEGEFQAKFLETAAHLRCNPLSAVSVNKDPQQIFLEIGNEILKIADAKRQHLHYLRNVKVCGIESKPKNRPATFWKTYKELMDVVPSDCFTTALLLHCLVEDVCTRVPDPKPYSKKRKVSSASAKASIDENRNSMIPEELEELEELNIPEIDSEAPIKELANYVLQYKKTYSHSGKCGITYGKNKFHPKINLKISRKHFTIHETSTLECKLNTYQQLSKHLLTLNINYFTKSPATLLWNLYPQLKTIEVVYKNHQVETWRRMLNLSKEDVQISLSAIQLDLLQCSAANKTVGTPKISLQYVFPAKNDSRIYSVATPNIKYIQTPDISLVTLNITESCLRIPEVSYTNYPNIYEAKNMQTYLWYEKLPRKVMVEQLQHADYQYSCIDHKYCPYNDAIMLRFHNNSDMFGINSTIWTQFLRTPVCFRDFCKYIVHDEAQWLYREEETYQHELKKRKKHPVITKEAEAKEGTEGTKETNANEGTNDTKAKEGTKETEAKEGTTQSQNELTNKFAQPGEPFQFYAYDLGEARIQLSGSTTIFNSMDGYKITIDRATLIGQPSNISINVSIAGHSMILHYNQSTIKFPFMFHFCLSDGTILVFVKSTRKKPHEISMAEKCKLSNYKHKVNSKSAYKPRDKNYYCVTEIKRWYVKTINLPATVRKCAVLDETGMTEYIAQSKKKFSKRLGKSRKSDKTCQCDDIEQQNPPNDPNEVVILYTKPIKETSLSMTKSQAELIAVLQKIEEAKKFQVPMFKVYSSKFHKYEYVKRIKSNIHITIGRNTIHLPCKPPMFKTTRHIEVVKVFPIKLTDSRFTNNNYYDLKMSSPSGLLLYTLPGINNQPFNIRQKYIETTPYCKNIINEDSRSFMRNGHVVIKKNDGTLDILCINGQIIHCEIPHSAVQSHRKYSLQTKQKNSGELSTLESRLCRIVYWRRKHEIRGKEARYFKYRRINQRQYKLQTKHSKQIYVMRRGSNPSLAYTLMTHDGKKLKVTNTHIEKQKQFYQTTHAYESFDNHVNIRDDGTTNLMTDSGIFITQFNDKTKISSWFVESDVPIILEDDSDILTVGSIDSIIYEELVNNGWVLVQMFYKFEHPNYATILYSCDSYETEIIFPNNVVMNITENGHYFIDVDRVFSSVINDELVYLDSISCKTCAQRNITVFNIKPLYNEEYPIDENTELLKTCDSYEKIFMVNYNGRCFRNSNYIKSRNNRADCPYHDKEDFQQLFVLNRDLSGSKFWDIKAYRKRIIEATDNSNTVLQYYGPYSMAGNYISLEMRTYNYNPYHMRFINHHLLNNFIFRGYQNEPIPPKCAYTTLCHLHSMPQKCMRTLLESSVMENNAQFPEPDHKDTLCRCNSQIKREDVKFQGKSVFDEHLQKVSSALLLLKRWYTWHEFHKPYVPPTEDQLCKCKPIPQQIVPDLSLSYESNEISEGSLEEKHYTSLEIIPKRVESVVIEPYKQIYKAVCECNVPPTFTCECKANKTKRKSTEEKSGQLESDPNLEANLEAQKRITSIAGWSRDDDFLENFYVLAEQAISVSDIGAISVSETVIQEEPIKPPSPPPSPPGKSNQRPIAPKHKKKVCTADTCYKQNLSITSARTSSIPVPGMFKRQAGGADVPPKESILKNGTQKPGYLAKLLRLKELQKIIMDMVLAAGSSIEVSPRKVEHYKVAVAIDIISNISQEQHNAEELSNLIKKLKDIDMNKYKKLPAEQLSGLILSLSKPKIKDIRKASSQPRSNKQDIQNSSTQTTQPKKKDKEFGNKKKIKQTKKKVKKEGIS